MIADHRGRPIPNRKAPDIPIDVLGSNQSLIPCMWNGTTGKCRGCGAEIGFALTDKRKKWIPFDPKPGHDPVMPHWKTCPKADSFRRKGKS